MDHQTSRQGLIYGCGAFGLWGVFPLYFKCLGNTPPIEILAHRVVWASLLLALLISLMSRWRELLTGLRSRRACVTLLCTTLLIGANWLVFIYAITSGQVIQSSLGYFMTPLANVLLGVVVLRERLRSWQFAAIALAAVGVVTLALQAGELPWIALALASTFSLYGLLRKTVALDGLLCLMIETLVLLPAALSYLIWLPLTGHAAAFHGLGDAMSWLLMASGPITAIPLLWFAAAVRRLSLSTLGILQYLAPTLQFAVAVLVFREPFSTSQLAAFSCIWMAVAIYTYDSLRHYQRSRAAQEASLLATTIDPA